MEDNLYIINKMTIFAQLITCQVNLHKTSIEIKHKPPLTECKQKDYKIINIY